MLRSIFLLICTCILQVLLISFTAEAIGPQNPPYGFHELTWEKIS